MADSLAADENISFHLLISGLVQGVGYRYSTYKQAQGLGVKGWVKNLPDGRVEVVVEGSPELVNALVAWCHRGSQGAVVQEVIVEPQNLLGFTEFAIDR